MVNVNTLYGDVATLFINRFRDSTNGLTDTQSPVRARSEWILASFPTVTKHADFPEYPLIIVESPDIEERRKTFERNQDSCVILINVLHQGNIANLDTLSSELLKNLRRDTDYWKQNGLIELNITSSKVVSGVINNSKYHSRVFAVGFKVMELPILNA